MCSRVRSGVLFVYRFVWFWEFIKFDLNLSLGLLPHRVNLKQMKNDDNVNDDIDRLDDNENCNDDENGANEREIKRMIVMRLLLMMRRTMKGTILMTMTLMMRMGMTMMMKMTMTMTMMMKMTMTTTVKMTIMITMGMTMTVPISTRTSSWLGLRRSPTQ